MAKRQWEEGELHPPFVVGKVPRLYEAPPRHPQTAFESDAADPRVAELIKVSVDLSVEGLGCVPPAQRLHRRLMEALHTIEQRALSQGGDFPFPRQLDDLIPPEEVPTEQAANEEVYGTPERPATLLSLRPEGLELNARAMPRRLVNALPPHRPLEPTVKEEEGAAIEPDEVVLAVTLYHPTRLSKAEEFKVLGSQTLLALRRAIYCVTDCKVPKECTRSACFFIGDAFYIDTSHEGYSDYSAILKEADNLPSACKDAHHCPTVPMHDRTFNELSIRLEERYLYLHAGGCAHYVTFTSARLFHPKRDSPRRSVYPDRIFCCKPRLRRCSVCDVRTAKQLTYNANDPKFRFFCRTSSIILNPTQMDRCEPCTRSSKCTSTGTNDPFAM